MSHESMKLFHDNPSCVMLFQIPMMSGSKGYILDMCYSPCHADIDVQVCSDNTNLSSRSLKQVMIT